MNKEHLKKFIEANEELTIQLIERLKNHGSSKDDLEMTLNMYSEVSGRHLASLKQMSDIEAAEESFVIEYEKLNVEAENQKAERDKELQIEIIEKSAEIIMQIGSMIFYTARFRDGLRFELEDSVSSSFFRTCAMKLTDFMKIRK